MDTTGTRPGRRAVLAFCAGTALAAALPTEAFASSPNEGGIAKRLSDLEQEYSARLGVFAHNTATGRTVTYRSDEHFPMCSVFKPLAAAAALRDLDRNGTFLAQRISYTKEDVSNAGYCPVTEKPENIANGMTGEDLCAAAVSQSDNGAANLLLRELGGPTAITRFCRSIGDKKTRLDRWEPELNSAEPWRNTDVTTPRAIGHTFARLILGNALAVQDRSRLKGWLIANTTNGQRFRAGLPADWTLADKTGGGKEYGIANDVGVVWPPGQSPLVLSILSTKYSPDGPTDNPLVAKTARLLAASLT